MSTAGKRFDVLKHCVVGSDGVPRAVPTDQGRQLDRFILALRNLILTDDYKNLAGIHGGDWVKGNAPLTTHAHADLNQRGIVFQVTSGYQFCHHRTNLFCVWHRPYMAEFERALQDADQVKTLFPGTALMLPFWNWDNGFSGTLHPLFTAQHYDVTSIDGRNGRVSNPFHPSQWRPRDSAAPGVGWNFPQGAPANQRRARVPQNGGPYYPAGAPNPDIALVDYFSYNAAADGFPHGDVHVRVGGFALPGGAFIPLGEMTSVPHSSFDPIFWLHHCNVERHFVIWQKTHCSLADGSIDPNTVPIGPVDAQGNGSIASRHLEPFGTPADVRAGRLSFRDGNVRSLTKDWWSVPAEYEGLASGPGGGGGSGSTFAGARGVALRAALWFVRVTIPGVFGTGLGEVILPGEDSGKDLLLPFTIFTAKDTDGCPDCAQAVNETALLYLPVDKWPNLGSAASRAVVRFHGKEFSNAVTVTHERDMVDGDQVRQAVGSLDLPSGEKAAVQLLQQPHCRGKSHSNLLRVADGKLVLRIGRFGAPAYTADFSAALEDATAWWNANSTGLVHVTTTDNFERADAIVSHESLTSLGRVSGWTSHAKNIKHSFIRLYVDAEMQQKERIERVLRHEIGHVLGLDHSSDAASVMYPLEADPKAVISVRDADVVALRELRDILQDDGAGTVDDVRVLEVSLQQKLHVQPQNVVTLYQGRSDGPTVCPLCGAKFSTRGNAARHVFGAHGAASPSVRDAEAHVKAHTAQASPKTSPPPQAPPAPEP
jgi:uncharacterized C2H2 Zn-finger protein